MPRVRKPKKPAKERKVAGPSAIGNLTKRIIALKSGLKLVESEKEKKRMLANLEEAKRKLGELKKAA